MRWIWVLLIVACGGSSSSPTPDAAVTPDSSTSNLFVKFLVPDLSLPPVTITVIDDESTQMATTTSSDELAFSIAGKASVTSAIFVGDRSLVTTILDVEPGDHLELNPFGDARQFRFFSLTVPFASATQPATYSLLPSIARCHELSNQLFQRDPTTDPPPTFDILIGKDCDGTPQQIVVQARDGNDQISFLPLTGLVMQRDGSATATGSYVPATPVTFTGQYTNVPASTQVNMVVGVDSVFAILANGGAAADVPNHLLVDPAAEVVMSSFTELGGATPHRQVVLERVAGNSTSYSMDGTTDLLPPITDVSVAADGQSITIAEAAPTSYGLVRVRLSYTHPGPIANMDVDIVWTVFASTTGTISVPQLPESFRAGDTLGSIGVVAIEDDVTTYATARLAPETLIAPVLEALGQTVHSRLREPMNRQRIQAHGTIE